MIRPQLSPNAWLRYDAIRAALGDRGRGRTVLEVGCGGGALGARLARDFDYTGYEPDTESFETARSRLAAVGRGRVRNELLPAEPTRSFDVVCAFEVLEHIEDDAAAVDRWRSWLRPGGRLVLSVPANPRRFGPADEAVGHYRRYTRAGLETLLDAAGFSDIDVVMVGFPFGYVLEFVRNRLARRSSGGTIEERTAGSGRWFQLGAAFGVVAAVVAAPFRLIQRPFARTDLGTGYVVCARRPD